jgi:predicted nucleic acid-binding protein
MEQSAQGWLQIASEPAGTADTYQPLNPGVDAGEASAISKERGLVPACAPLLNALRSEGYYLSDSIVAAVLDQAAEPVPGGRP